MAIGSIVGTWEHASHGAPSTNVDYTTKVLSFSADFTRDAVEDSKFGVSSRQYVAGLKAAEISVSYEWDDTINDIIEDLYTNGTAVTFEYSPVGGTTPNVTGSMFCTAMNIPVGVGELLQLECTFQVTGDVTFN